MNVKQQVHAATRSFVRAPSFALTAVLTLALGLGLSIAVFTVADALLLRRLPVANQDRLVTLWGEMRDHSLDNVPLHLADAREFARRTHSLQSAAFFTYEGSWPAVLQHADRILRLRRGVVSGNFFDVLGTRAFLGRTLRPADDIVGAAPVTVISYRAWRGAFSGDPAIIGKHLTSGETGYAYTIVGVMPAGLEYPNGTEFWLPIVPLTTVNDSTSALVNVVARLSPAATAASAQSELTAFLSRADATLRNVRAVAQPLPQVMLGDTRTAVWIFSAAAALLLLITCINVTNLLLVRGLARGREIAVRTALGASRSQLIAHLLMENGLLALAGGAIGVVLASVAVKALIVFAPADIPLLTTIRLDPRSLMGAIALTAIALLVFGIIPALATARMDGPEVLRSGARQSGSRRSRLARELLVGAQVALAVLILAAAALLARSLIKLENAPLQFDDSHLLVAELGIRYDTYNDVAKQLTLVRSLLPNVQATPGIRGVSPVLTVPFSGAGGWDASAMIDGQSATDAARNPMFNLEVVTPDYFPTLGLQVARGRPLMATDRSGAALVAVVSQSMARGYWPNQDALGKHLLLGPRHDRVVTIVGVVPDTRYRDLRDPRPSVYFPLAQSTFSFAPTTLVIRTSQAPATVIAALRHTIAETAPGVVLANAASFENYEAGPLAQPRLDTFLLLVFALAAALLAGVGLFGVMATLVRQRTRELGVRMALGATAQQVQSLVMKRGLILAGGGIAIGVLGAALTNQLVASLLFDVRPTDAITLTGAGALLLIIALAATFVPARASARIDPALALRADG